MSAARALGAEVHALADAEAVLLVDDGEAEVVEGHVGLEEGVGADQDRGVAVGERARACAARSAPLSRPVSRSRRTPAASASGRERVVVLAGEDLGRGHQRRLAAGLDGGEHGEERDQGLAGADVALEQAVHPAGARPCRR